MEGIASLTCPECGRVAKSEAELLRRRPRRRWRLVGVVVLLAGWCVLQVPEMMRHGWAAVLPDWALVVVAPSTAKGDVYTRALLASGVSVPVRGGTFIGTTVGSPPEPPLLERLRNDAYVELWRRLGNDEVPGWLAGLHLRAAVPPDGTLGLGAAAPDTWPFDAPDLKPESMDGMLSDFPARVVTRYEIDKVGRDSVTRVLDVHAGAAVYELRRWRDPIDTRLSAREFMGPVSSPELNADFGKAFTPGAYVFDGLLWVEFHAPIEKKDEVARLPALLWVDVSVLLDGEEVGAGHCDLTGAFASYKGRMLASIAWNGSGMQRAVNGLDRVEVVLSGNPAMLFPRYMNAPRSERRSWAGEVRIRPLSKEPGEPGAK